MNAFFAVLHRDLRIAVRRWGDVASPLVFFAIVVTLFPLALSPERATLKLIGPGVLWIGALLAVLLSLNALFREELADGSLEQLVLAPRSLAALLLGKAFAHWLVTGLPVVLLAPLLAVTYHLPVEGVGALVVTLLLGTPTLCLLGAVGAALTASARQSGGLLALLLLPLALPVLMFGARATDLAAAGESIAGPLYLLGAFLALALTLLPLAAAAAVRISVD